MKKILKDIGKQKDHPGMVQERKDLKILFDNRDPKVCSICGKPSLPNFYGACSDEHRKLSVERFLDACARVMKGLPKVRLHF